MGRSGPAWAAFVRICVTSAPKEGRARNVDEMSDTQALSGKVALVTGAGRGQGRSHAVALAQAGADVVICDIAADVDSIHYPLASSSDLATTAQMVEQTGRECLSRVVDVRDAAGVQRLVDDATERFGSVDICVANAGVCGYGKLWELTDQAWREMIDINLTGVFNTLRAVTPGMIERRFGRIVATSSGAGRAGNANLGHYVAAKWGLIGLVKTLALETAKLGVTANVVCPSSVDTAMLHNQWMYDLFCPDLDQPTHDDVEPRYVRMNQLPRPWLQPDEVSRAVLFLVSDVQGAMSGEVLELGLGNTATRH